MQVLNETSDSLNKLRISLFIFIGLVFFGYIFRTLAPFNFEFTLVVAALISGYVLWKTRPVKIDRAILTWFLVLFLYWFTTLIASIYHAPLEGRALSVLNVVNSVILFAIILLALIKLKPGIDFFWGLLGVASISVLALMFMEVNATGWAEVLNGQRFGREYSHPVKLGVYANTFFIVLLGSLPWAYRKNVIFFIAWVVMIIALLLSVIFIQTRTAWIGWPEAIIGWGAYYLYLLKSVDNKNWKLKFMAIASFLVLIIVLVSQSSVMNVVEKRIGAIFDNIETYTSRETFNTSVGARLLSYEAALVGIKENPWMGIGENRFMEFQQQKSSELAQKIFDTQFSGFTFTQIHNQFLMSWLTKGVFALISVVLIFVFLISYFVVGLKHSRAEDKAIWVAGLVFSVAAFMSFMPETPLQKSDTATHFFLMATLLLAFTNLTKINNQKVEKG